MTDTLEWVEVWKWDWRHWPEKVRVLKVNFEYYLEEGDDHTKYKGNYFDSPAAAYEHAIKECEQRIASYKRDKETLERVRENFFKKNPKESRLVLR